jgi:uncharacterized tellurite resistance protein B-like protein
MLDRLRNLFQAPDEAQGPEPAEQRLHLAAAMLLLEIAWADFDLQPVELEAVGRALARRFDLDERKLALLLEAAQEAHEREVSIHPHVQEINRAFDLDEKERLIEQMWRVAFSDQALDKYEEGQIRRIAELLHLPHARFIRAKLRAQASGAE